MTAHATDLAPAHRRPYLAFLLALLSIPGSTLAWELPAGGYWIGVPLCVAAIVLGLRARPGILATTAIGIPSLAVAMMLIWTLAELAG